MVDASKMGPKFIWRELSRYIYFVLYVFVRFFIFIGEIVEHIVIIPIQAIITFIRLLWRYIQRKSHGVISIKNGIASISTIGKGCITIFLFLINLIQRGLRLLIKGISWLIVFPFRLISAIISPEMKFFILGIFLCLVGIFLYSSYQFVVKLPSPTDIGKLHYPLSTHIYDRNGKLLYEIYKDQNRTVVKLKDLPAYVYQASIAIEDKDFYLHNGVSFLSGIVRAAKETLLHKSLQGGSTITQQLVKSALLSPERTIQRKLKEIILALWTEKLYTKQQILEMYVNQVPYGGSSYGIEEASKTFFGKSAKEVTISEAAFLAGLPQAPSVYSPYTNPDLALSRRNEVLQRMNLLGYISKEQLKTALNKEIGIRPIQTQIQAPHFVFYAKEYLEKQYGIQQVEEGGMRVFTSLDLQIQKEAEMILREELQKVAYLNISNGAVLVTRPKTGEILAMVGSVDYFNGATGAFNVTTALRQPGSSIKPVTYALALKKEFTAATLIDDSPTVFAIQGSSPYVPVNYDGRFHGRVPFRYALANSFNIPAVKILNVMGVSSMIDFARELGITSWEDTSRYGLSLTLGGGEVRMVDMVTAYGVFANKGVRVPITPIKRIYNSQNELEFESFSQEKRVVDEEVTFILSDILSDNFARRWEFGTRSALEIPGYRVAVKTGTTDMKKDNWTIGYTPDYVVAVWVGNNDNSPMNQYLASGITGAAPIWNRVMTYLVTKYGTSWYTKPTNVVEKQCFFGKTEYFIRGTETKTNCSGSSFGVSTTPNITPTSGL